MFLRRFLDGMEGMEGMEGSDGKLPDGVWHSVKCEGHREISYENFWMAPFILVLCILAPWGWLLRLDGLREGDFAKRNKGYRILGVCIFIGLIFVLFENGINHSPADQIPYSNKIVYGAFVIVVPLYLVLRDRLFLCPPNATCCGLKGGKAEMACYSQGLFWDYGMMGISSVGVPMCGIWSMLACHDVQIELGHWVPFLGYLSYAGILLYFAGPSKKNSMHLQYAEGWMWISWGLVFNIYFTPGSGGGLFYPLFHHGEYSPRWAPDQQHIFQAMLYIFAGLIQIVLGKLNYKSGAGILLLSLNMYKMLSMHPQYCLLARDMHRIAGQLFLLVGILRFFGRILETSLTMTILAGAFVFSTSCTVTWGDAAFEASSFVAVVMMIWGTWWAYIVYLYQDHWNIPVEVGMEVSAPTTNGTSKKYAPVAVAPQDDDEPLESGN